MGNYRCARGCVELARGNTGAAIDHFDYAAEATSEGDFASRYLLAGAYSVAGRTDDAIREYTALLSKYYFDSTYRCVWMAKSNYQLARAYEQTGRTQDAATYYRRCLYLWRDADAGLDVVDDARRRLSALETGVHEREL